MIWIGVDTHKTLHVAVAVDDAGRAVGEWSGPNTIEEWARFRTWLVQLGDERRVGIEGSGSYGYGLARSLLSAGEVVYEVNSRLTALERRHARRRGKSDQLDAHAVAQVVRRDAEALPRVTQDEESSILAHLCEEREALVSEATRVRNRLHATLLTIDPEYKAALPPLHTKRAIVQLQAYEKGPEAAALERELAASVRRQAKRLSALLASIEELGEAIEGRATRFAPLTEIRGISHLTAGTLAGILGCHGAFKSDAQLASFAGVAPLEASSAGSGRHRLSRTGNRRLNAILYRIAICQLRYPGQAKTYLEKKMREGRGKREAIRTLKRYIIRAIWQKWKLCTPTSTPQTSSACL